jgi:hypothetical protein
MNLFRLREMRTKKIVSAGGIELCFPNKVKAKEARARFNLKYGCKENDCFYDHKQVKPFLYEIRRGPDHNKGVS